MEKGTRKHIEALNNLGKFLAEDGPEKDAVIEKAGRLNPWFTRDNIVFALSAISSGLQRGSLGKWLQPYGLLPEKRDRPLNTGLILAGNIPLVGFHDILCILVSGHRAVIKLSSQDTALTPWLIDKLVETEPTYAEQLSVSERLGNLDAVLATGSNNSARYFDFYFGKYPHVIRKNRNSTAVITGNETKQELELLGRDIFQYFGLGCRNVSKLFIPRGYDPNDLLSALEPHRNIIQHYKYANNFDYQLTLLLMNQVPHSNNGFILLTENASSSSPIATLHYEYYEGDGELMGRIHTEAEKLQCIASSQGTFPGSVPFGQTQLPALWDYADKVDTLKFLLSLDPDSRRADS